MTRASTLPFQTFIILLGHRLYWPSFTTLSYIKARLWAVLDHGSKSQNLLKLLFSFTLKLPSGYIFTNISSDPIQKLQMNDMNGRRQKQWAQCASFLKKRYFLIEDLPQCRLCYIQLSVPLKKNLCTSVANGCIKLKHWKRHTININISVREDYKSEYVRDLFSRTDRKLAILP